MTKWIRLSSRVLGNGQARFGWMRKLGTATST